MSAKQQYDTVLAAMAAARQALGLFEMSLAGPLCPESLIGVQPQLRASLDNLAVVAHDLKEGGVL